MDIEWPATSKIKDKHERIERLMSHIMPLPGSRVLEIENGDLQGYCASAQHEYERATVQNCKLEVAREE